MSTVNTPRLEQVKSLVVFAGGSRRLLERIATEFDQHAHQWQEEASNFSGEGQKRAIRNMRAYQKAARLVRDAQVTLMQETT